MKNFNFIENEHQVLKMWKDKDIFNRMREKNANSKERFNFLDGPITANARMCMHHVWGRSLKDAFHRYNTLKGRSMHYQMGFDAQGMWVEVEVEKDLGLKSKTDIQNYGLANFTEKCIERVDKFKKIQSEQSQRLGMLMDWDNSYITNSDDNITGIWHFLKEVDKKGWLKRSYKSMPWCPRCGTSLSEHEMSGQYKELTHRAVFAKLRFQTQPSEKGNPSSIVPFSKGLGSLGASLLIWTTTPWTLCANVAVAVNPDNDYVSVRVKSDTALLIVGKEAVKRLREDLIEVVDEFKGSKLVGLKYEKPLKFDNVNMESGVVIPWDDVDAKEGSGLVHIAPGCGAEDFELGKIHNLEPIIPIDEGGLFKPEFEYLAGLSTEKAEDLIFEKLNLFGTMYYTHPYTHNYPYCWRCKTNVVFRLVEGWDIATTDVKPAIFRAIDTVNWQPQFAKKMMVDWITNMGDWNISRRRFYGLPLPFYPCDCGHVTVVGSLEELKKLSTDPKLVDKIPHLHRPYIDEVLIKCEKCSLPVKRVADVGDCWLDAGIAPFATKKYFTDKKWWQANFPSDIVMEMKEQIRLWFYSMLFMSVVMKDVAPWKKVLTYGTMLDEDGKKFSKTGPKNIPFDTAVETFGADSMRYIFCAANPALDMRFGPSMIDEAKRKLMSFMNTVQFFNTYAEIDKPKITATPSTDNVTDQWLTAATDEFIRASDNSYASADIATVTTLMERFVDDLSNFYIRTNRRRFWKGECNADKQNAYVVLFRAIRAVTVVLAPISPFLSEYVWRVLVREYDKTAPESVMLADFPKVEKANSTEIISQVEFIKNVTTLAHSLRAREGLKVRQPLRTLYVKTNNIRALELFDDYLREELNVKEIKVVAGDDEFTIPYLSVNFKKAGAKLGSKVQKLKQTLETLSGVEMLKAVGSWTKGMVKLSTFGLLPAELFERKLKSKPEFVSETAGDITVVLDTTLDDELVREGKLRELIRAIQVARQDANLDITARIALGLAAKNKGMRDIIDTYSSKIADETLAKEVAEKVAGGHKAKVDIDGADVVITFKVC